eukprot:3036479-Prymnesium_polylepis.1
MGDGVSTVTRCWRASSTAAAPTASAPMPATTAATPPAIETVVAGCAVGGEACAAPIRSEKKKMMNPSTGARRVATRPPVGE